LARKYMSLTIRTHQRGTSSFSSDEMSHRRFQKKNQVTRFSKSREGMRISINKGTKSIWISKKPFMGIPYEHDWITVNRGTQRLKI
jgi:hypothetical protein